MSKMVLGNSVDKFILYHYEITNDGRRILILEPNIFKDYGEASLTKSCLEYLSGNSFTIVHESDLSKLDLLLEDEVINANIVLDGA